MKYIALLLSCFFSGVICQGQSIYLEPSTTMYVVPNTPVNVDGFTLIPSTGLSITGQNSVTRTASTSNPPAATAVQRFYTFLQQVASYNGTIMFSYDDTELNGLNEDALNLTMYDGSVWKIYMATTRDNNANVIQTTGLTNINFAKATLTSVGAVPVKLTSFQVSEQNCTAYLSWTTESESNSRVFIIESSTDGISFGEAGREQAAGQAATTSFYRHAVPVNAAVTYFRLKMLDIDGSFSYSPVIIHRSSCGQGKLVLYPNPARIGITLEGLPAYACRLILRNSAGQLVSVYNCQARTALINVSALPAGNYSIQVVSEGVDVATLPFIKL